MDPNQQTSAPETAGPDIVSSMPQQAARPAPAPVARNSSIGPIIGAVIIIILLIAGAVYFWQQQQAATNANSADMNGMKSTVPAAGTEPGDTGSLQTGASVQGGVMIPATTTQ